MSERRSPAARGPAPATCSPTVPEHGAGAVCRGSVGESAVAPLAPAALRAPGRSRGSSPGRRASGRRSRASGRGGRCLLVRGGEPARDLAPRSRSPSERNGALLQPRAQASPPRAAPSRRRRALVGAEVVDAEDVRVRQGGDGLAPRARSGAGLGSSRSAAGNTLIATSRSSLGRGRVDLAHAALAQRGRRSRRYRAASASESQKGNKGFYRGRRACYRFTRSRPSWRRSRTQ